MNNRRKSDRFRAADYAKSDTRYVKRYFKVLDRITDKSIGYMINVSSEGMMVLSKSFIRENNTYKLRIELPEEVKGSDHLIIDARSVWCERDPDSEFYRVGFSFITTFPHHEEIIQLIFTRRKKEMAEASDTAESVPQTEK